jgi:hypothetical protein
MTAFPPDDQSDALQRSNRPLQWGGEQPATLGGRNHGWLALVHSVRWHTATKMPHDFLVSR